MNSNQYIRSFQLLTVLNQVRGANSASIQPVQSQPSNHTDSDPVTCAPLQGWIRDFRELFTHDFDGRYMVIGS